MKRPVTYRLILEYNGARFDGWQVQPGRRTVQRVLEAALRRLFRRRVATVGASRTDAGVHAAGQVASFRAVRRFRGDLRTALNALLPRDVAVVAARTANPAFHARRSAVGKTYRYRLFSRPARPALDASRVAWVKTPLDLSRMRREARRFLRRREFAGFAGASSRRRGGTLCRLKSLRVGRRGSEIVIEITADRFLNRMARRIVGRLLSAGGAPWNKTAEARGLTLQKVWY